MTTGAFPAAQQVGTTSADMRKRIAMQLLLQGGSTEPVQHWAQGVGRVAQGVMGGMELGAIDRDRRQGNEQLADYIMSRQGAATPPASPAAPGAAPAAPTAPPIPYAPPQVDAAPAGAPPSMGMLSPAEAQRRATEGGPSGIPPGLIASESGGQWGAQNSAVGSSGRVGHFGRLQFGQDRLQDGMRAGVIPQGTTPEQFMASPQMQQAMEQWHFADIDRQIAQRGLGSAVGTQIGGTTVTPGGMRAVAHLGGMGGLQNFIQSGGRRDPADTNGTTLSAYLAQHAGPASPGVAAATAAGASGAAPPMGTAARPGTIAGMDRATLVRLLNNEHTAPMVQSMIAQELAPTNYQLITRSDGSIMAVNPRSLDQRQLAGVSATPPTYGVIGNDVFGRPQHGWIDPHRRTVTPGMGGQIPQGAPQGSPQPAPQMGGAMPQGAPAPQGAPQQVAGAAPQQPGYGGIPGLPTPPPGANPAVWLEEHSRRVSRNALPASDEEEARMRGEVQRLPSVQRIGTAVPIFNSMVATAGQNTRAADLDFVYGLAKIFDPESVVREGEMTMVRNTGSIPEVLMSRITAVTNGTQELTPQMRRDLLDVASTRVQQLQAAAHADVERFRTISGNNRANPQNVLPSLPPIDDAGLQRFRSTVGPRNEQAGGTGPQIAPQQAAPAPAQQQQGQPRRVTTPAEAQALPPGTPYETPDGQRYVR